MQLNEIKLVLNQCGLTDGEILETKPGQLSVCCPLAPWFHNSGKDSNPSMGIRYDGDYTIYHCFTCGESGKLWSLVESIGTLKNDPKLQALALEVLQKDQPNLFSMVDAIDWCDDKPSLDFEIPDMPMHERMLDHFDAVELHDKPMEYLRDRNVPEVEWERFKLRYDRKQDRLVFPVFDTEGQLRGAVGRTLCGDKRKYYNYFNMETGSWLGGLQFFSKRKRIIIVEGFFCLIRGFHWAHARDADILCAFGSKLTEAQVEILTALDAGVQIWFDNDDAGNKGWDKLNGSHSDKFLSLRRAELPPMTDVDTMSEPEFEGVFTATKFRL